MEIRRAEVQLYGFEQLGTLYEIDKTNGNLTLVGGSGPTPSVTEDGAFTLKAVYCLGNCALGPTLLIGEDIYGRVDADRFDEIISERRRGDPS